jgi:hypothetical protein
LEDPRAGLVGGRVAHPALADIEPHETLLTGLVVALALDDAIVEPFAQVGLF